MSIDRRNFLTACGSLGFASTLLPGVLYSIALQDEEKRITADMIDAAATIAGIPIAPDQKEAMLSVLNSNRKSFDELRKIGMGNDVAPAFIFDPLPSGQKPTPPPVGVDIRKPLRLSVAPAIGSREVPKDLNGIAFSTVRELGEMVRRRKVSSTALTEMYIDRLKRYDPYLHFVITITEERARAQAKEADKEIAAGKYRGILHGLPWGGKDLLAAKGYPTTWGAGGFEDQMIDEDATVVKRLDQAGAVLVAKLTLGALAMGDKWFGGQTRNPWNIEQGSSGSSAGPASATSAGCVAFSIGSETGGSISGPSTRCGVTGFRPTFGFVPRTGAMTLGVQPTPEPAADATEDEEKAYERRKAAEPAIHASREYDRKFDLAALEVLRNKMGITLIPVEIPKFPYDAMRTIYTTEGAAAFDWLTLSGKDKLLAERSQSNWPNAFRAARLYPAVEYIQDMRVRALAIRAFAKVFEQVDVIVTPTTGPSNQVTVTNLTGHPAVIVPNGLRGADAPAANAFGNGGAATAGAPAPNASNMSGGPNTTVSLTFLGGLYKDAETCALAHAYQQVTDFHKLHPPLNFESQASGS